MSKNSMKTHKVSIRERERESKVAPRFSDSIKNFEALF